MRSSRHFALALLLGSLLFAFWDVAETQEQDPERSRVIAAVRKAGGKVEVNVAEPGAPVSSVDLSGLMQLNLDSSSAADGVLQSLEGLTSLRRLNLQSTDTTDAGLEYIQRLTGLQELKLGFSHPALSEKTSYQATNFTRRRRRAWNFGERRLRR